MTDAVDGGAPRSAPTGADPSRADVYLAEVTAELNVVTNELERLADELIASARDVMISESVNVNSLTDELIGSTDLLLSDALAPVIKIWDKVYKETLNQVNGTRDQVERAGFVMPASTADMTAALAGDWVEMVASAAPMLQTALGCEMVATTSDGIDDPMTGGVPTYTTSPPTYSPPTTSRPATDGEPCETVCCPAPVNVTVNVPPIVLPAPQIAFNPSAPAVTVNVPPPGLISGTVCPPTETTYTGAAAPPGSITGESGASATATSFGGATPSPLLFPFPAYTLRATNEYAINWGTVEGCDRAKEVVEKVSRTAAPSKPPPSGNPMAGAMDSMFGGGAWDYMIQRTGLDPAKTRDFVDRALSNTVLAADSVVTTIEGWGSTFVLSTIAPQNLPNPLAASVFAAKVGAAQLAEQKTGVPLSYLMMGDLYALHYSNPQFLPNQIRTDSAFLANQITAETWECWTQANGNLKEPSRRIMLGDQLKPNLMDLITLYRRGNLKLEDLPKRARELGVLEPAYLPEWLAVTKALPTMSDLISFMVRDASDDGVAKKYGYDTDFGEKFTPQMKEWATGLGLDETFFRYAWRSHWRIPSYTQLVEMLFRLRPDRLEVQEWEAAWGGLPLGAKMAGAPPRPIVVTAEDVKKALQVDDMAPGWVEQMMVVSATPINRTDSIRAYMTGAFTDEQLYDAFRNVKYSERDARLMLDYYKRDKARRNRNLSGTWSPRKVVRYYKLQLITREEADRLLSPIMPNRAMVNDVLDGAEQEIAADLRAAKLKSLKRQFLIGEFSPDQAQTALLALGLDLAQVVQAVSVWIIERDGRRKQPTVAMIGKWVKLSIMSMEEARKRLGNLGYAMLDADRILAAALKWEFDGAPPSAEELSGAVEEVVKNQSAARKKSDAGLMARLKQIATEATRIWNEANRRRENAGDDPLPPMQIP